MKPCPHCQQEIQDEAIKCRWCQRLLVTIADSMPLASKINWQAKKPYLIAGGIILIVLILGLAASYDDFFGAATGGSGPNSQLTSQPQVTLLPTSHSAQTNALSAPKNVPPEAPSQGSPSACGNFNIQKNITVGQNGTDESYTVTVTVQGQAYVLGSAACDFFNGQSWLRVQVYTGGAHCCTINYWLPSSMQGPVLYDGPSEGEGISDGEPWPKSDNGVGIFADGDDSLDYFSAGDISLPYAMGPRQLPLDICFSEQQQHFYDCTRETPASRARIMELGQDISNPTYSDHSNPDADLVEYLALNILLYGTYDPRIAQILPRERSSLLPEIVRKIEEALARRAGKLGAINQTPEYFLNHIDNFSKSDALDDAIVQNISPHSTNEQLAYNFYVFLHNHDYNAAISNITPTKQNMGSYQYSVMASYYGGLVNPIEINALRERLDKKTVFVSYRYSNNQGKACSGTSDVITTNVMGSRFIQRIVPLEEYCN